MVSGANMETREILVGNGFFKPLWMEIGVFTSVDALFALKFR